MAKKALGTATKAKNKIPIILGIVVLLVLLLVAIYYFMQVMGQSLSNAQTNIGSGLSNTSGLGSDNTTLPLNLSVKDCLASKGYTTFLFLHSPYCPHCQNMQPIIDGLTSEGYQITKVDVTNSAQVAAVSECVKLQSYVPQFVCHRTGASDVGEMDREQVIELYNNCMLTE